MSISELSQTGPREPLSTMDEKERLGSWLLRNLRTSGWEEDLQSAEGERESEPSGGSGDGAMRHFLKLVRWDMDSSHALAAILDRRGSVESVWSVGFGQSGEDTAWLNRTWSLFKNVLETRGVVTETAELPVVGASEGDEPAAQPGRVIAAPVLVGDRPVAVLAVGNVPEKDYSLAETRTLKGAAFVLGQTLREVSGEGESREVLYAMIQSLAAALDARDAYTRGHSDRVAMCAMAIANELGEDLDSDLPGGFRDQLRLAALLHDIGKIGIRDDILLKPAALTDQEYAVIKQHPVLGAEIVKSSGVLDHIIPGILYHHERCDGSGYPVGLRGDEIPPVARIIGLADAFDAMTSDRTFRPGMSQPEAVEILRKCSGSHFAPELVEALIRAYGKGVLSAVRVAPASARVSAEDEVSAIENAFPSMVDQIPSLPAVVGRLNQMVQDPDCSVGDIARVLSTDEGLVSRVLRIANSAFYALPGRVGTIPLAITILGINTLRSLVIGTALADLTRSISDSPEVAERLWDHGVDVGVWSRWIARKIGGVDPEEAFTAGLLHDIGKGLVLRALPPDRERVRGRLLEAENSSAIEKETLGFDHAELGGWAATRWRLPAALVRSVRWHHEPEGAEDEKAEVKRLVWVVHISNILAWGGEAGAAELAALLTRKADPMVLRSFPVKDEASIEELLPFVERGIDLARQLFSEPVSVPTGVT